MDERAVRGEQFREKCGERVEGPGDTRGKRMKTVGILGGMGPWATAEFYRKLLEATPAAKDWDHLRVIIDSNPHIPSRTRHFLYGEDSPVSGMIESCNRLARYPVDMIVIPCNSACYFWREVQAQVDVPVVNIISVTAEAVRRKHPSVRTAAALGGMITYEKRTYEPFLAANDVRYVHHRPETQRKIEQLIEQIKLNDMVAAELNFRDIVSEAAATDGADAVILACTELGLCSDLDCGLPIVDSSTELAEYTVRAAKTDGGMIEQSTPEARVLGASR